ncbi:hypothetical protein K439DRAFT_1634317 [Ramaria rubella]|nr:hypothetical protein K439DRAFT_1634307 [Ramaria rubella]KAF8583611.1 hypothetical protein K439DRAFT_1634317 [Ramaria rubella]
MGDLSDTFMGCSLTLLFLARVNPPPTADTIRIMANIFPQLKIVTIVGEEDSSHEYVPPLSWPDKLEDYAQALKPLRDLEYIAWNNSDGANIRLHEAVDHGDICSRFVLEPQVKILGAILPNLSKFEFHLIFPESICVTHKDKDSEWVLRDAYL